MKFMLRCVEERYSTQSVVMAILLCTISTIHSVYPMRGGVSIAQWQDAVSSLGFSTSS